MDLAPLQTLYEVERGNALLLPEELAALYGLLQFPPPAARPHVIGNFVTTLDGVVSLNIPGHASGADISGFNKHDRMVMGLLRAVADAVIIGAGTLRASPAHLWTAEHVYPPLAGAYSQLRSSLGKTEPPLNVIVTARGELDLSRPIFRSGKVPVLIITTQDGLAHLSAQVLPSWVQILVPASGNSLAGQVILQTVTRAHPTGLVLVEAGPHLMGDFLAEQCLDELFLTLAPQIAGRDDSVARPGLVAGKIFAPAHPLWGTLVGVKLGGSHLFLRYALQAGPQG